MASRNTSAAIKALVHWFEKNQRAFPWRENPHPYWVWIAEIMSQQTQMSSVVPYFYRFIKKFPDVNTLAQAPESDVLAAWAGLGYYSRARNLQKAAQAIAQRGFPRTFDGWLELSGVGEYTAAAVVSQAFGQKHPVWDGNVQRVCSRFLARGDVYSKNFKPETLSALSEWILDFDPSTFNQAFMELGATVCTPKQPRCGACPLSTQCLALRQNRVTDFPPPKPRKETVDLKVRSLVFSKRDKKGQTLLLMHPRPSGFWFSGLWDFRSELGGVKNPQVKLEVSVHHLSQAVEMGVAKHHITHHKIALKALLSCASVEVRAGEEWIALEDLVVDEPKLPVSTTAKKVLKLIARELCLNKV
jgi:A/G-specific adenine glycosylase